MIEGTVFDVRSALAPLRRALGMKRSVLWVIRGLGCGAAAGAMILVVRHFFIFGAGAELAFSALVVGVLAACVAAVVRWPSILEAARTADRVFTLKDRLTTALEFQDSYDPLAVLQRRDVKKRISGLPLAEGARFQLRRRDAFLVAGAVLLFGCGLLLPAAQPATVQAQPNTVNLRALRQTALRHLQAVRRSFSTSLEPKQRSSAAAKQTLATFSNLANQLKQAKTQAQALRVISAAQTKLAQVSSHLGPISQTAARQFDRAVHRAMTRQERAEASKGGTHLDRAASRFLNRVANTTSSQSAGQRQQTARTLQRASGAVSDTRLKSDLSKAASALGHNDLKTASQALRHAEKLFRNTPSARSMQRSISHARKSLDSVKNDVNGLHKKAPRPGLSAAQNPPPNHFFSHPPADGGKKQGISQVSASQRGKGPSSAGTGPGGDAKGAPGVGVGRTGSGAAGPKALVYVPGLAGKGQHILPVDLQSKPRPGSVVPYQRVIAQYSRSARSSLERSPLPPSLRGYVRQYFTVLSKQ